jgi:excisionase family DNA binding protein
MTRSRQPIDPLLVSPSRRGGGSGEPAAHPVPPPSGYGDSLLLDSREVARLLRIGRTKTFQMMATAELPTVRIGRCVRVPREALRDWVLRGATLDRDIQATTWLRRESLKSRTGRR